jgi:hypothetical protein
MQKGYVCEAYQSAIVLGNILKKYERYFRSIEWVRVKLSSHGMLMCIYGSGLFVMQER